MTSVDSIMRMQTIISGYRKDVATRDSGSGQVESTKLDRTWVLLDFI